MEFIRGGELLDILIDGGVYTERDAARAMKQAFLAISYLHSQGIVHRDLKLQNLLLTEKERTSDLKVCDFGLSAQIPRDSVDWSDREAIKGYRGLSDKWGTPHYFAPEMLQKAYGPQVDLWALGVVLFQLLVGRLPFNAPSNAELFRQIERSPEHVRRLRCAAPRRAAPFRAAPFRAASTRRGPCAPAPSPTPPPQGRSTAVEAMASTLPHTRLPHPARRPPPRPPLPLGSSDGCLRCRSGGRSPRRPRT